MLAIINPVGLRGLQSTLGDTEQSILGTMARDLGAGEPPEMCVCEADVMPGSTGDGDGWSQALEHGRVTMPEKKKI